MAKRKRDNAESKDRGHRKAVRASPEAEAEKPPTPHATGITIQIVTGSYERVLHGITATISQFLNGEESADSVEFSDAFLFHAHTSAIRCLALSPIPKTQDSPTQNIVLASGSTDERVNLYNLSISPPVADDKFPSVPTLAGNKVLENPKNRELGSLFHHSSTITSLCFPSRSKLLASSEDNTISVVKTRDWSVISTIKAPRPKLQGRPSGDTAPPGAGPAGINDFAVHPSMKLMLSVGRGEKCMRLWNLVTGKKAGVLNFSREILESVKEGKWSSGEGRQIIWDSQGQEFAVAFERGLVVFGIDSEPKCRVLPSPLTKIHHIEYVDLDPSDQGKNELLAVSTENGQVLFYDTKNGFTKDPVFSAPMAPARCRLGGKDHGQSTRIKHFEFLSPQSQQTKQAIMLVTCSSDGTIKIWSLLREELKRAMQVPPSKSQADAAPPRQVGKLLGSYESGDRITCLRAFIMAEPRDPLGSDIDDGDLDTSDEVDEEEGTSGSDGEE